MFEDDSPEALVKILDFGLACKYSKNWMLNDKVGTVTTMSPELLKGEYNYMTDMWSIGVIAFQLLSGELPFPGKTRVEIANKIVKANYDFNGPEWDNISKKAKFFVYELLQLEPKLRMTASKALKNPWMINYLRSASSQTLEDPEVKETLETSILRRANSSFLSSSSATSADTCDLHKLAFLVVAHHSTSSQDIQKLRSIFYAIDANHDGRLTLPDLKKGLSSLFSDQAIEAWFASIDVGGCGEIDYTEFIAAAIEAQQAEVGKDTIKKAFRLFDEDNTGYITHKQLRRIFGVTLEGKGGGDNEFISTLIGEAGDGIDRKVSFADFQALFEKNRCEELEKSQTLSTVIDF